MVRIFTLSMRNQKEWKQSKQQSFTLRNQMPFSTGAVTTSNCLATNSLTEVFILQFSRSATTKFLSNYNSFYTPNASDAVKTKALIY